MQRQYDARILRLFALRESALVISIGIFAVAAHDAPAGGNAPLATLNTSSVTLERAASMFARAMSWTWAAPGIPAAR
jgi:hypothetical protein